MVKADLKDFRGRCVARDVPTQFSIRLIGSDDHSQRVPSDDGGDFFFDRQVARISTLLIEWNGIAIGRIRLNRGANALAAQLLLELVEQKQTALRAAVSNNRIQRIQPLARLGWIGVGRGDRLAKSGFKCRTQRLSSWIVWEVTFRE